MFRFLATLLATGVGLLAASAWWSGRDTGPWPDLPSPASEAPGPTPEAPGATGPEPPAVTGPEPAAVTGPEPAAAAPETPAARDVGPGRPAGDARPEARERAIARGRPAAKPARAALAPIPGVPAPEPPPRRVPPVPAPELGGPADLAGRAPVAPPMPDVPDPIPAPFAPAPPPPADTVGETRIPEPAWFEDEVVDVAGFEDDEGFYGEENVIYNEADEAPDDAAPSAEPGDEQVAMNDGREASARRIRRLLDVYESLRSRR
jgi:hypothetical protein